MVIPRVDESPPGIPGGGLALPRLSPKTAGERHQVVRPAVVFLDRDGVINANLERGGKPVAPTTLAEFRFLPGSRMRCVGSN